MLLLTVAIGSVAAYLMTRSLDYFPVTSQALPTALIAAVSAPILYLWQSILKITDLQKLSGVSNSEFRRLAPKIKGAKIYYGGKICFTAAINLLIGICFFLSPSTLVIFAIPILKIAVGMLGFMAVFSFFTVIECYLETHAMHEFEVKVAKRTAAKNSVEEKLAKLNPQTVK